MSSILPIRNIRLNARGRWVVGMREDMELGILGIDKNKLRENILSVCRRTTRKKINGLPNRRISDEFREVILRLLQGIRPGKELIAMLKPDERLYYHRLVKSSHVVGLELPKENPSLSDHALKHKFYINLGEIDSGNDSQELKDQTIQWMKEIRKRKLLNDYQLDHISSEYSLPLITAS